MKLFELNHNRIYPDTQVVCQKGIGVFPSREKALKIIEQIKDKEGFQQIPEGFCIEEFEVDAPLIITEGFDPAKWIFFSQDTCQKYYWILQYSRPYPQDDYYDEVRTLGYFSTKKKAVSVKKFLENKQGFQEHKRGFFIEKCVLNRLGWEEGFVYSG